MSNNIILKKSSVGDKVPLSGDLEYGELALNYTDGNLFYKNSSNVITTLTSNKFVSVTGNVTGNNFIGSGTFLTGINAFGNIAISGGNTIAANNTSSTLSLIAGTGIAISGNSTSDAITISAVAAGSDIFVDGADFGTVTEAVTISDDLGLVTELVSSEADLGEVVTTGLIYPTQFKLPDYTVATLPSATVPGLMIFVSDAAGGSIPAFSDGTNWRRVDTRAVVS